MDGLTPAIKSCYLAFPRKDSSQNENNQAAMEPKPTVLVPLYIYPLTSKTWQPLYEAYVYDRPSSQNFLTISFGIQDIRPSQRQLFGGSEPQQWTWRLALT